MIDHNPTTPVHLILVVHPLEIELTLTLFLHPHLPSAHAV